MLNLSRWEYTRYAPTSARQACPDIAPCQGFFPIWRGMVCVVWCGRASALLSLSLCAAASVYGTRVTGRVVLHLLACTATLTWTICSERDTDGIFLRRPAFVTLSTYGLGTGSEKKRSCRKVGLNKPLCTARMLSFHILASFCCPPVFSGLFEAEFQPVMLVASWNPV